jgi:hypothetical protein
MNLTDKGNLDAVIGKANFWNPKQIVGVCEYVGGIPEVDKLLDAKSFFNSPPLINFKVHKTGLEMSLMVGFKQSFVAIPLPSLESVILEQGGIIDVEERSVIGRAVVGGLLLGPLGAIVGGASGLKDKVIKDNDTLLVNVDDNGTKHALLMTIKKGKTAEVKKFFTEHYGSVFSVNK